MGAALPYKLAEKYTKRAHSVQPMKEPTSCPSLISLDNCVLKYTTTKMAAVANMQCGQVICAGVQLIKLLNELVYNNKIFWKK